LRKSPVEGRRGTEGRSSGKRVGPRKHFALKGELERPSAR